MVRGVRTRVSSHVVPGVFLSSVLMGSVAGLVVMQAARAADVTPAEATVLEQQAQDWFGRLLGPSVRIADRPVRLTAAGDHYDVVIRTFYKRIDGSGNIDMTATARQATDGTWAIEDLKLPSPIGFTATIPVPAADGRPATSVPVTYTLATEGQDQRILWDPSFTRPSTWTTTVQSMAITANGGPIAHDTKVGLSNSIMTLRPAGPDRADVLLEGTLQDFEVSAVTAGAPMQTAMKRVRVSSALTGVSRSQAVTLVQTFMHAFAATGYAIPGQGQPANPPPKMTPEMIRALLAALQGFASGLTLDEMLEGLTVKTADITVGIDQMKLGFAAKAENGLLQAGLELGMDGLALPEPLIGDMAALVPRRVALHPFVSGLGVAELSRIASEASEGRDPSKQDVAALFSHGGIGAGLESMTVDVAGAVFSGQGKVVMAGPSPDQVSGTAQITADHFDALMQKVTALPELAQAVPALVFIKGVGRIANDQLVWDVSYDGGKLLVNNVDLIAMAAGQGANRTPASTPMIAPTAPDQGGVGGAPKTVTPRARPTPGQIPSWGR